MDHIRIKTSVGVEGSGSGMEVTEGAGVREGRKGRKEEGRKENQSDRRPKRLQAEGLHVFRSPC